jgi:DNA-directed RNA polymerase subunit RPC12/RpoP
VCPKCRSKVITRSVPKDAKDHLMLKLRHKRPYRCLDCNHRFYDRPLPKQ